MKSYVNLYVGQKMLINDARVVNCEHTSQRVTTMRFDVLSLSAEGSLVALLHAENVDALGAPFVEHGLTMAEREVLPRSRRDAIVAQDAKKRKAWARGTQLRRFMRADGDGAALSRVASFLRFEVRDVEAAYYYITGTLSDATREVIQRTVNR